MVEFDEEDLFMKINENKDAVPDTVSGKINRIGESSSMASANGR